MFLIKFMVSFSISFIILCFPIGQNTLFSHAYKIVSPVTNNVFSIIKKKAIEGYEESRDFTKQFFSNSTPTEDRINKVSSSTKKIISKLAPKEERNNDEGYTVEEREILKKILTEAQ